MVASASLISSKINGSSIVAGTLNSSPSAILHTVERNIFPDRVSVSYTHLTLPTRS